MERHSCSMPCLTKAWTRTLPKAACCVSLLGQKDEPCVCMKRHELIRNRSLQSEGYDGEPEDTWLYGRTSRLRTLSRISLRLVLLYLNKTGPTKLDALCRRFDQREIGPLQNLALWKHIMVTIEDGTTTITAIGTELLKSRNEGRGDGHRRTRPNLQLYSAAKNDRVLHVRPFLQCVRVTHFWIATILYLICS
jgi:hypothetical protein